MNTDHFRTRLTEEKALLESELATVGRKNPSNPNDWEPVPEDTGPEADPNDRADQMEEFGNNNAILTDLEARYNSVLAALARMDTGTYGVCETSGEAIEEERLEADPAARTCKAHLND
ncbi:MAG TPA: TraR/DksA C4-type zinc finger protein [Candidatus Paceibacterota bacterium]|nr:TraR/DksA C4-type zinc finger protein [Candidatus Paceibacterota bacterium]